MPFRYVHWNMTIQFLSNLLSLQTTSKTEITRLEGELSRVSSNNLGIYLDSDSFAAIACKGPGASNCGGESPMSRRKPVFPDQAEVDSVDHFITTGTFLDYRVIYLFIFRRR